VNFNISNSTSYRALVGALLYIMLTSPDNAFAVVAVSRCCQNPGPAHWKASKHILAYLLGTINYGLCFSGSDSYNVLTGFTDSDFTGCPDTRHSTTGVLYLLNQAPVTWKSRLKNRLPNRQWNRNTMLLAMQAATMSGFGISYVTSTSVNLAQLHFIATTRALFEWCTIRNSTIAPSTLK
jgi:hypothetical protein